MHEPDCPYLHCETSAYRRVGLDLAEPGTLRVTHAWFCRHPFHGLTLELGDAWLDVQQACKACSLPREYPTRSSERGDG
jgi:hypothetical protein